MRLIFAGCLAALVFLCSCSRAVRRTSVLPAPQPHVNAASAGDEPDKAQEFYVMKRAGAGVASLPYEKYEAARQRADRMPAFSLSRNRFLTESERSRKISRAAQATLDLGGWQPLGPGNQGGRTRHLLIHPTDPRIMYAGAATGGVWKTTDAGANWFPITDEFPALGIGGLAFDPANPDTLYVGTGFWFNSLSATNVLGSAPRGAGIFRSRNAGESWIRLPGTDAPDFRYINEIIVSRGDSNRIYVATWTGIFRTLDGGDSWQRVVNRGGLAENGCQDMVMRTDRSTDYLFASCGTTVASGPVILRNTDAAGDGAWTPVYSNPAMGNTTLALAPSNQDIVYALMASNGFDSADWRNSLLGLWRSTASGDPQSWEPRVTNEDPEALNTGLLSSNSGFYAHLCSPNGQRSIGGQGWIHNAIAVDPLDPERVFVAGIDIYRSDDGGRNWGIASFWQAADGPNGAHADVLALVYPPDFEGNAKPHLYAATDGGVYLTRNSRAELATGPRAGCAPPYTNRVDWQPLHGGYQSTQFYSGAVLPGGASFLGGKQDNGTMRGDLSTGNQWLRLRGGDGAAVAVDRRDPNILFVSTQNFGLTRSTNGGRTFSTVLRGILEPSANFSFIAPLAMDPTNPDRLYAGARIFYRTDNQADNWSPISTQLSTAQGTVSAIAVSPADPSKVIFATSQGFLFRTADALNANNGTAWEFARPRPGFVPAVAFDPVNPDVAYAVYSQFNTAAGQSHVYRTADGGITWTGIDGTGEASIPDIPVLGVTVDPLDQNRIYLGTDIGVFVTLDGGNNWARDQNPFASVPTEVIAVERGAGATQLYAFTFGRGVWRTTLPGTGELCQYRVAPGNPSISALGGELAIGIETGDQCVWSVIRNQGTLDLPRPAQRLGSGTLRIQVPLSTATTPVTTVLAVQDKPVTITQRAAAIISNSANSITTPAVVSVLPYLGWTDTRTATAEAADPRPSCAAQPPAKTIWLRVTPPVSGRMEIHLESRRYDVAGNGGVVVSAYSGNTGPATELACGTIPRNTGAWVGDQLQVNVTAGVPVWIQASATGNSPLDGGQTIIGLRMLTEP